MSEVNQIYTREEIKRKLGNERPICDATLIKYVKLKKVLVVQEFSRKCKLYSFNINQLKEEKSKNKEIVLKFKKV